MTAIECLVSVLDGLGGEHFVNTSSIGAITADGLVVGSTASSVFRPWPVM